MIEKKGEVNYEKPTRPNFKDRTGEQFNSWLIESFSHQVIYQLKGNRKVSTVYWNCLCTKCGETRQAIPIQNLKTGRSKNCANCVKRPDKAKTITVKAGDRHGLLEVIGRNSAVQKTEVFWNVKCHGCGGYFDKSTQSVKGTRSCGSHSCGSLLRELGKDAQLHIYDERQ